MYPIIYFKNNFLRCICIASAVKQGPDIVAHEDATLAPLERGPSSAFAGGFFHEGTTQSESIHRRLHQTSPSAATAGSSFILVFSSFLSCMKTISFCCLLFSLCPITCKFVYVILRQKSGSLVCFKVFLA